MHEYVEENGEKKKWPRESTGSEKKHVLLVPRSSRDHFFLRGTTRNLLLIQTIYYFLIFNILSYIFLYHC